MFRRPYACGVQSLDQIRTDSTSEEYEFTMKLYQCEEKDFYQLHELIIRKQNNKFTSLSGQGNYGEFVCFWSTNPIYELNSKQNYKLFKIHMNYNFFYDTVPLTSYAAFVCMYHS